LRETRYDGIHIASIFAHQSDAICRFVFCKHRAVSVEYAPPCRWKKTDVDTVLFGEKAEFFGLFDLNPAHAVCQHACKDKLGRPEQKAPARYACRAQRRFPRCASHILRPTGS
jgi:hypothetical protein